MNGTVLGKAVLQLVVGTERHFLCLGFNFLLCGHESAVWPLAVGVGR